ncbi:MAG: SDR family oxidoreductase [Magnetococcales bacterium]|nr:SDR family oxidoreductase [Magnetococcales bacterium]MBF0438021.1 SDR family oxidoreductase [Magnetococcales bacterium]
MDFEIQEKIALVTGGTHGIGRAIVFALAKEGCQVAFCGRNPERLASTLAELEQRGHRAIGITADVFNREDIDRVVDKVCQTWGSIDILVNNVGGGGRWGSEVIEETPEKVWMEVYEKNVLAAMRFTMKAIPGMRQKKWGRIITITSICGLEGGCRPWFGMAKAAQTSMMKNLAQNKALVRDGITFNSVAPGAIMIPDTGWAEAEQRDPVGFAQLLDESYPLGRLGTTEEVADLVVFIASKRSALINGAAIVVDGGESNIM